VDAAFKNLGSVSFFPLSVQLVPITYSASSPPVGAGLGFRI